MQLEHSFTIPAPVQDAWSVLLDIEQVATCMPGAILDSVEGDEFTGRVKVKLGPISLTYAGRASFVARDEEKHQVVIDARGKDRRGNGTAAAEITAQLTGAGDGTRVDVLTDLNITGKPAQFGRGAMTDVADKLLKQFADNLADQLAATGEQAVAAEEPPVLRAQSSTPASETQQSELAPSGAPTRASRADGRDGESIDLLELSGAGSVAKRWAPGAAALATVVILFVALVRRGRR